MRRNGVTLILLVAAAAGAACSRRNAPTPAAGTPAAGARPPAPPPVTQAAAETPPSGGGTFSRPKLGVKLEWPAGWAERPSDDYVLLLNASDHGKDAGREPPSISLDVPTLPPHLPGMIPIGSVRGGYLDDLRKSVGTLKTRDEPPPAVPNSAARLVRSTWRDRHGDDWQETALLLVHADRVYILRARSTTADEAPTRAAFDEMVRSLKWTK